MNTINIRKRVSAGLLLCSGLFALLAAPATVLGECLTTPNSKFTMLIDSSSSCEALSGNMRGCQTNAAGVCTIPNPVAGGTPIVVTVSPSNAVGGTGLFNWTATGPIALGGKQVDVAISVGATGGGTCGWSYTPGEVSDTGLGFLKSNGTYQKVNDIYFCSDFTAPPPALAHFVLSKTVMRAGGTCGVDDVEVLDVSTGTDVEYCISVENTGAGDASNVVLSDPGVFTADQSLGSISSGAPATVITSPAVTITESGENINSATVTWVNSEDPLMSTGSASDSSKVIAKLAIETCPEEYQQLVDGTIAGAEDFFGFAALYDPTSPERVSLCAPSGTTGIQCKDECIIKDICKTDPLDPACVAPNYQCEQSGAWSVGSSELMTCSDQSGTGGMPYCWELAADADKDCAYKPVQVMKSHLLTIEETHVNPFCFKTTSINIDGTSTTTQYCF